MGIHEILLTGILLTRNFVDMKFRRYEISSVRNSVDTKFRRHKIPLTWDSSVDTEFLRRHGIPPSTRKSPVDIEFPCLHGIPPSTWNSPIDTEFPRRHRIPSTRNFLYTKIHRISWNSGVFADFKSQSLQYV